MISEAIVENIVRNYFAGFSAEDSIKKAIQEREGKCNFPLKCGKNNNGCCNTCTIECKFRCKLERNKCRNGD